MKLLAVSLLAAALCGVPVQAPAQNAAASRYAEAVDLIHAYSESGEELRRALQIADALAKSHPQSGYAQTLLAEALSTWRLGQDGEPGAIRNSVIELAESALRLDPGLALAHVAKARALVRASMYVPAERAIDAALAADPTHSGAIFLRAEVHRRTGNLPEAEAWYRKFIDSTASPARRSNGYYWLGRMYENAARDNAAERDALTGRARAAYERMLELSPEGAPKNVSFAAFLNDYAADFEAAERHAGKALSVAEFPLARYHLAAARYQTLWVRGHELDRADLLQAVRRVAVSTGVSLQSAVLFPFSSIVLERLETLRSRISAVVD